MTDGERSGQSAEVGGPELGTVVFDVVSSAGAVVLIAGLLFAISGVWPPLVAIESGSMEPNIQTNDLVFVMEQERFAGPGSQGDTGIVTARAGTQTEYTTFQGHGDVIVYAPDGNTTMTPIIHRAMFWVQDGERWYDRANKRYVGDADNCEELANCPADDSGFVTKGDNNNKYDQVGLDPLSGPVRPEWVVGTAKARIPWLGNIRLRFGSAVQGSHYRAVPLNRSVGTAAPSNRSVSTAAPLNRSVSTAVPSNGSIPMDRRVEGVSAS